MPPILSKFNRFPTGGSTHQTFPTRGIRWSARYGCGSSWGLLLLLETDAEAKIVVTGAGSVVAVALSRAQVPPHRGPRNHPAGPRRQGIHALPAQHHRVRSCFRILHITRFLTMLGWSGLLNVMKAVLCSVILSLITTESRATLPLVPTNLDQILLNAVENYRLQKRMYKGERLAFIPNQQTPYTGWVKELYNNGQIKYLAQIENGKYCLRFFWFYNGQISLKTKFKDGKENGLEERWFENGTKQLGVNWKEGRQDGLEERWFENGTKQFEVNWKEGRQDGLETEWCEIGHKISQTNWNSGKKHGLRTEWREHNGPKKEEQNWINGKRNGKTIRWDVNGKKIWEENFKEDKKVGETIYFFQ